MTRLTATGAILALVISACADTPTAPGAAEVFEPTLHAQDASPTSLQFPSGAGMSEEGPYLLIKGRRGPATGGFVAISGPLTLTTMEGSGARFVCVDRNNVVYASPVSCDTAANHR